MNGFLILGILAVVGFIGWRLINAGADREKAKQGKANADAAKRVADAVAKSPDTLSGLRDRLRDGERKL